MVTAKNAAILLANLKNYHPGIVFPKLAEIRRMTLAAPRVCISYDGDPVSPPQRFLCRRKTSEVISNGHEIAKRWGVEGCSQFRVVRVLV